MIHLHVHSEGSPLDGEGSIKRIVKRAVELNMPSIGLSDHGNMIKTFEFQKECEKNNVKPIFACEFYMGEHDTQDTFHLLCIAKNNTGLQNLYKLNTFAWTKNFYRKPRITLEKLIQHKEGLIVTTACLGSEFGQLRIQNKPQILIELAVKYKDIFGNDFYLEIQPNNIPEQREYNKTLVQISNIWNIPLIVTTDAHYVYKEDAKAHDVMLAMQVNKKVNDPDRFKFNGQDYYLKSQEEILADLAQQGIRYEDARYAIANTNKIASMCNARIQTGLNLLPSVGVDNEFKTLCEHCNEGYARRLSEGKIQGTQEEIDRIKYELGVIKQKGYEGYFLIVEDFIKEARRKGIYVGAGRGSGVGCMVEFILGITKVNPVEHGLLFQRFLNPERNSAPDIDVDFDYERRYEMVEYVLDKYGHDKVSQIITEGTMACKAVVRRVLSVYDFEQRYINKIVGTIPDELGICLEDAFNRSEEFRDFMLKHREQYDIMLQLEGLVSHTGKHPAGVIISSVPITDVVPCMSDSEDRTLMICQWHKKIIEEIGLYKFDFLGLKTLTLLRKTVENIKKTRNIDIDIDEINIHDKSIYKHLNSGSLSGVFQFDAPAGKQIIELIQPQIFEDVVAGNALCRPGVKEKELYLQNKRSNTRPNVHPIVDEILYETYGAIVYQEQTMLLMNRLTGGHWTLGKADSMRKVKDLEVFREDFISCCISNGIDSRIADSIFSRFDLSYSFNKSHACAYAVIACMCAYLAENYYPEFMSALMFVDLLDGGKNVPLYVKECKHNGVNVLPPDINESTDTFVCVGNNIRYPLSAVANVGGVAVKQIMEYKPYISFNDFIVRVPKSKVNKRVVTNLIKVGAFDELNGKNRNTLLETFTGETQLTWSKEIASQYERELMGISLTSHPLDGYNIVPFGSFPDGNAYMTGIVSSVKKIKDKKNNDMAFITVENQYESIEVVVFSRVFNKYGKHIIEGIKTRMGGRKENGKMLMDSMEVI